MKDVNENAVNTATTLLERMGLATKNHVVLDINGVDFRFNLDTAARDAMYNEITLNNKVTPIKDYLLTIVDPAQRNDLLEIINVGGLAPQIFEHVDKALTPKINITVKN